VHVSELGPERGFGQDVSVLEPGRVFEQWVERGFEQKAGHVFEQEQRGSEILVHGSELELGGFEPVPVHVSALELGVFELVPVHVSALELGGFELALVHVSVLELGGFEAPGLDVSQLQDVSRPVELAERVSELAERVSEQVEHAWPELLPSVEQVQLGVEPLERCRHELYRRHRCGFRYEHLYGRLVWYR